MRINTNDLTLQRNYLEKYRFLMKEYELVKQKAHPVYRFAQDFYKANDTCAKSFLRYYNRYKQSGQSIDLLPQKRGPRYKTRRPVPFIENKVIALREKGNNKYEIVNILRSIINHVKTNNGKEEDAKDIFQEVIIDFREKVIQNRFILTSTSKIKTFLFAACKRKWLNELRKKNKIATNDMLDLTEDFWQDYEEKRELTSQHHLVIDGMQELGDRCRKILQYYCDRVSMVEIAIRLGFEGA